MCSPTLNFNVVTAYWQSFEWDARNILAIYSYNPFSYPYKFWGIVSVGVIGGWSPLSYPYFGLLCPLDNPLA